jgi:hypothetical protein
VYARFGPLRIDGKVLNEETIRIDFDSTDGVSRIRMIATIDLNSTVKFKIDESKVKSNQDLKAIEAIKRTIERSLS